MTKEAGHTSHKTDHTSHKTTESQTTRMEKESEMATETIEKADLEELEEARLADLVQQSKEENDVEPEEIVGLRIAFERIGDKIQWHRDQMLELENSINEHEAQIATLQETLRNRFGGLVGEISGSSTTRNSTQRNLSGRGRPKGSKNNQATKTNNSGNNEGTKRRGRNPKVYGEGNSTGDLIAQCLRKANKPVDTKHVISYLRSHGNDTNPSVELNRMKQKGLITQPERGLYEWNEDQ